MPALAEATTPVLTQTTTEKTEVFIGDTVTAKAQSNSLSHAPHTENLSSPDLTIGCH